MKEIIYKIVSQTLKINWGKSSKLNVLIETNSYFTKELWNNVLQKNLQSYEINIRYYSNKFEGYKLIKEAQVVFSFGDNKYYSSKNLKMQYYGISQPDILNDSKANVYYARGFSSKAIAEYCLAYSLFLINDYGKYFKNQANKIWEQNNFIDSIGNSISDKAIGVLGLGCNGKKVADLFNKLGCKVYGFDIKNNNADSVDVFCSSFKELLESSDIIIATISLTPETKNLFNVDSLSKMKKNAYFINVSRGGIVNENDLYNILKSNKIAGAVLDVTAIEPLSRYSKLWNLDNIIITPHISGNINKYHLAVMNDFSDKLHQLLKNSNV